MREERSHGVEYDTSFQHRKEQSLLPRSQRTGKDKAIDYQSSTEDALYTCEPLPIVCAHTGRRIDPHQAVFKAGVVPYSDESAARADWRRFEREALFLNAFADRFGQTVTYEDYALTKVKLAEDETCWLTHAQPEAVFGKHAPPPPVVVQSGTGITRAAIFGRRGFVSGYSNGLVQELGGRGGQMPGAQSSITAMAVAEQYVATGTVSGEVIVGSWTTGEVMMLGGAGESVAAHTGAINDLHAAGYCLGVAGEDSTASVWDASTGEEIARLEGHGEGITSIRLIKARSAVVDTVATGSRDASIRLWDLATKECLLTLDRHGESVFSLDLVGDRLFSSSMDGIKIWSASTGACLHQAAAGEVHQIKVIANIAILARSGKPLGANTEIVVYDWERSRVLSQLYVGNLIVTSIDASPSKVSATLREPKSEESTVLAWDYLGASRPLRGQLAANPTRSVASPRRGNAARVASRSRSPAGRGRSTSPRRLAAVNEYVIPVL